MRKTIAILLALMLLGVGAVTANAQEPITLKFWESANEGANSFTRWAAEEYTKLNPHITFEFEDVHHTNATERIQLDGPAGIGPDFFLIPHDTLGANVSGGTVLANPDAAYVLDNFLPAAITGASLGGEVYGFPMSIETYALFYNKDILPEAPTTFEEVIAFAGEFNNPADNQYAFVWEPSNAYFSYIFFSGYGSSLFGPTGAVREEHSINAPDTLKGVEFMQSLRSIADVPAADLSQDFCNQAFGSGKAAMYVTGPWFIETFKEAGLTNFGITTIPALPGQSAPPTSFSG
ncbi:MAG: extracellular solute-binding protein, partial [Clostridia bacterium]|nr:extracellular solute-binding protein [Clostridia bacterium]